MYLGTQTIEFRRLKGGGGRKTKRNKTKLEITLKDALSDLRKATFFFDSFERISALIPIW